MKFDVDIKKALTGLAEVETKTRAAALAYGMTAATKLEAQAKKAASWTDRTGNARNTIRGTCEQRGAKVVVALSGNMNYSPYLELANHGKYAVLRPTVQKLAPEIIAGVGKLLK